MIGRWPKEIKDHGYGAALAPKAARSQIVRGRKVPIEDATSRADSRQSRTGHMTRRSLASGVDRSYTLPDKALAAA